MVSVCMGGKCVRMCVCYKVHESKDQELKQHKVPVGVKSKAASSSKQSEEGETATPGDPVSHQVSQVAPTYTC